MILADYRKVAIRRSLLPVFWAYLAKYFTHSQAFGGVRFLALTDIFIVRGKLT